MAIDPTGSEIEVQTTSDVQCSRLGEDDVRLVPGTRAPGTRDMEPAVLAVTHRAR